MKWYERITFCLFSCLMLLLIVAEATAGTGVTVSAALSLKTPFEEIGKLYEKRYPGSGVSFNFGPSGALQKQIEAGAPADIFAAASPKEMDSLEKAGLLLAGSRHDFAGNSIVLITSSGSALKLSSLNGLKSADIKRIAIGNPATVPAGRYAEETLRSLGLWDNLKAKLIFGEHVRQVMDYVTRNEVDAGMVFLTDALSGSSEVKVAAEAPASSHKPVVYTIAVIKGTKSETAARNFISVVVSKEGREILKRYGFKVS